MQNEKTEKKSLKYLNTEYEVEINSIYSCIFVFKGLEIPML